MKKIVIAGATSSIMSALIDSIKLDDEYYVVGITTSLNKDLRPDIEWVKLDLSKDGNDYSFIEGTQIIIHAAAVSNSLKEETYFNLNLKSTESLVNAAIKFKVDKFVYISSFAACMTCGNYGCSKLLSENYIRKNLTNWLIFRPSVLYGYSKYSPIDSLILKIKDKKIIPIPSGDPPGLMPLYYLDAAKLMFEAIFIKNISQTVEFIVGPQLFNYKGLALEIAMSLNKKPILIPIPKSFFMIIKAFIGWFKLSIGIYPDQIVRLFNPNEEVSHEAVKSKKEVLYLSDYVKEYFSY